MSLSSFDVSLRLAAVFLSFPVFLLNTFSSDFPSLLNNNGIALTLGAHLRILVGARLTGPQQCVRHAGSYPQKTTPTCGVSQGLDLRLGYFPHLHSRHPTYNTDRWSTRLSLCG